MIVRLALIGAVGGLLVLGGASGARPSSVVRPCYVGAIVSAHASKVRHELTAGQVAGPAAVADGRGGWYVAGRGLSHVRADGRVDPGWHSALRRTLQAGTLARYGDRVFVSDGRRVFAVDVRSGRVLWDSAQTHAGSPPAITSVVAGKRRVYLGGGFRFVGSANRGGVAALDPTTGRVLSWQAPTLLSGDPDRIYAAGAAGKLALSRSRLYVVGGFNTVGVGRRRFRRPGVAAIQTSDGRLTGFVPHAQIDEPVLVAAWRRLVVLGCGNGRASNCHGDSGVFDARTGRPVHRFAFDEVLAATAAAFRGSIAYLGSDTPNPFGGDVGLIAVDLRSGRFEPWWFPKLGYYTSITSIAVSRDRVWVGGFFCAAP